MSRQKQIPKYLVLCAVLCGIPGLGYGGQPDRGSVILLQDTIHFIKLRLSRPDKVEFHESDYLSSHPLQRFAEVSFYL